MHGKVRAPDGETPFYPQSHAVKLIVIGLLKTIENLRLAQVTEYFLIMSLRDVEKPLSLEKLREL